MEFEKMELRLQLKPQDASSDILVQSWHTCDGYRIICESLPDYAKLAVHPEVRLQGIVDKSGFVGDIVQSDNTWVVSEILTGCGIKDAKASTREEAATLAIDYIQSISLLEYLQILSSYGLPAVINMPNNSP